MLPARISGGLFSLGFLLATTLAACGGDGEGTDTGTGPETPDPGNSAPTIAGVDDQTVVRNTLTPRSLERDLQVEDPDGDPLTVTVESDDESVVPGSTLDCASGPCALSLTPAAGSTAHVTISLTVADGNGAQAETSFVVHVVPRLVTTAEEAGGGSLRATVAAAEAGDVIGFDTDGVFASPQEIGLLGQIEIDKTLTIEGPGAAELAVHGNSAVRVFKVTGGASVTIRDLTVRDGKAPLESFETPSGTFDLSVGGGVLVGSGSRLELRDVVLTGNEATGTGAGGGGAANVGGTLIVTDSEVSANAAASAGGVLTFAGGGTEVATTLQASTVDGNTATGGGGGLGNQQGILLVRESAVTNNQADDGGGIHSSGTLVLGASARVAGNEATEEGGGVWSIGEATVEGGTVEENEAARGGGIYNRGTLDLEAGTSLHANASVGPEPGSGEPSNGGGGLFNASGAVASIVETSVTENRSRVGGGGLLNQGELTAETSAIEGNVGDSDDDGSGRGGGLDNEDGQATISATTVQGNSAAGGGGISNGASLILQESEVLANTATAHGGGLRSISHDALSVTGTTIAENSAARGGGVRLSGTGEKTIEQSVLARNEAQEAGGGLYYEGSTISSSELNLAVVDATTIEDNSADRGGGVFYNFSSGVSSGESRLELRNGTVVSGNEASEGAGIYQTQEFGSGSNAETVIDDSSVEVNGATGPGGGILIEGGLLTATAGANVGSNTSGSDGGGIHIRENAESFREIEVTIEESGVVSNEADRDGGGLFVGAGGEITVVVNGSSCLIVGNSADADDDGDGEGGGLYNAGGDISGVPSARVCANSPDDIAP